MQTVEVHPDGQCCTEVGGLDSGLARFVPVAAPMAPVEEVSSQIVIAVDGLITKATQEGDQGTPTRQKAPREQ